MFAVLSDPAIYEFENAPPASEEWLKARFERLQRRGPADHSQQWLNWVVRVKEGELAGYVQATVLASGVACVAYELNSRFWRQGIGSSAVRALLLELQGAYEVVGFVAVLKAANYRSRGLLVKLGFTLASAAQAAIYSDGEDELVMVKGAGRGLQLPAEGADAA